MLINNTVDERASKLGVPSSPLILPTLWPLPNTYGLVDRRSTWWTCPSGWRRWAWGRTRPWMPWPAPSA